MARKRVNIKFLIILSLVVVLGGGAALGFQQWRKHRKGDPTLLAGRGDALMTQKKFGEAAGHYQAALSVDPQNAGLLVKYGDALRELSRTTPEVTFQATAQWEKALEVDPRNMPALQRLLNDALEQYELTAMVNQVQSEIFDKIQSYATKILDQDPSDAKAFSALAKAGVEKWLSGVQLPDTQVDDAIKKLTEVMEKDPTSADAPFTIARARLKQGQGFLQTGNAKGASDKFKEATDLLESRLKQQPDNAMLQWRTGLVYAMLARVDRDHAEQHLANGKSNIEAAMTKIKADDKAYVDVHMSAGELAKQQGKFDDALRIYGDLYKEKPNEQSVRLAYAKLLSLNPATRSQAIDILSQPFATGENMVGFRALLLKNLQVQTTLDLANYRLDQYATLTDATQREALFKEVQGNYDELLKSIGDVAPVMKLRGKMQLVQNDRVAAIQTLSRAKSEYDKLDVKDLDYYDLVFMLANASYAQNLTGEAKTLLQTIIAAFDKWPQARIRLAQLYIQERSFPEAKEQIDVLEKIAPNDPQVIKLRMAVLDPAKDKEKLKAGYGRLPEGTRDEMLNKALVAQTIGNNDDAVRLLTTILKTTPGDPDSAVALARLYFGMNKKEEATKVIETAQTITPNEPRFELVKRMIANPSNEEVYNFRKEQAQKLPDAFDREMAMFSLEGDFNHRPEAVGHLLAAEKLKPTDPVVMEKLFFVYLQDGKLDQAEAYIPKLSEGRGQDQAEGLTYRFQIAMARGDRDGALKVGRELTAKRPEFYQSWLALAKALHAAGDYEQAVEKYIIVTAKQTGNVDAIKGIIDCYYRMNRPDDAQRYIAQGRQAYPDDALFKELEINHDLNFNPNPEKALAARAAAVQKNPEQPNLWLALGTAYIRVAQIKSATDESATKSYLTQARDTFTKAIQKWPDERTFYGYLAQISLLLNDVPAAQKALQTLAAREAWKDKPEPYRMLGDLYSRTGKLDEAEAALRSALDKSTDKIEVQQQLAMFLTQRQKVDEALKVLDENASDPRIERQRVEILINGGRPAEAEKLIKAQLEKSPKNPGLMTLLAIVYMNTKRLDEAQDQLTQALAVNPSDLPALYWRGLLAIQRPKPDPDAAIADLTAVRNLDPTNADARFGLAQAYHMKHDPDSAIRELEGTLKLVPNNKSVRLKLIEFCAATVPAKWSEVEQLITEAKGMPIFASDPDWDVAEGMMWLQRGESRRAVVALQDARKLAPANAQVLQTYFNVLLETKNYPDLIKEADKVLADPKTQAWWVYRSRGLAKNRSGDKAGALDDLVTSLNISSTQQGEDAAVSVVQTIAQEMGVDEAISRIGDRTKTDNRWRMIAASLYQAKGDNENMLKMVDALIADREKLSAQDQVGVLRFAGMMYMGSKPPQTQKAYDTYLLLLEKTPDDLGGLNNIACLLSEQMQPPRVAQALAYSQKAYDLMRQYGVREPLMLDTHGWMLVLSGNLDDGIAILRDVVNTAPFIEAYYHLGEAYLRRADPENAQKELVLARDLIGQADSKSVAVDPELRKKIETSLSKAGEQVRAKSGAGN